MNQLWQQIIDIYKAMPFSRKIIVGSILFLVLAGFASILFLSDRKVYQPLYTGLTAEDAAEIVNKLKEQKVDYKLESSGTAITVPKEMVYDIRLSMAQSGLPKGGGVGFEIFDKTDFGTTEFVQKLNYQRAIQGELSRTIGKFSEVDEARVMIVLPKESVFIEEEKQPSVSVLLKLNSPLAQEKVRAIVHLVASSVQDMTPERVTVIDNNKKLWPEENLQNTNQNLASIQLAYKLNFEQNLVKRIQSMIEGIIGKGKAIVRVSSDMTFDQIDFSEEIYNPEGQVIRSKQSNAEKNDKKTEPAASPPSTVNANVNTSASSKSTNESGQKQNETVNYEITKTVKKTVKPTGELKRLYVSAALDGNYSVEKDDKGNEVQKYLSRTPQEIEQFRKIVQNAMGYNSDREDQITVESFPFSNMAGLVVSKPKTDWLALAKDNKTILANLLLILLIFLFIVRPVSRTVKEMRAPVAESALPAPEDLQLIPEPEKESLPEPKKLTTKDKASTLARTDVDKTIMMLRGWING